MTLLSYVLLELAKAPATPKKLAVRYTNSRGMTTSLPSAQCHVRRVIGAYAEYFQRPDRRFYGQGMPVSLTDAGRAKADEIAATLRSYETAEA